MLLPLLRCSAPFPTPFRSISCSSFKLIMSALDSMHHQKDKEGSHSGGKGR